MTRIIKTVMIVFLMFGVCTATVEASNSQVNIESQTVVENILSIPNVFIDQVVSKKKKTRKIRYDVPSIDTTFKAFLDFRKITDKTSLQWELQRQAYTDYQGMRRIDGFYCVAMGTYYSVECGDKFQITLSSGRKFDVIVSDIKDDRHTNKSHMYTPLKNGNRYVYNDNGIQMGNVVEFIVDKEKLSREVKNIYGCISSLGFEGNVTEIFKLESDGKY